MSSMHSNARRAYGASLDAPFYGVRQGVVVLRDGDTRVLAVLGPIWRLLRRGACEHAPYGFALTYQSMRLLRRGACEHAPYPFALL
jgi:hypothetical protein